jgi:hypothetical protein
MAELKEDKYIEEIDDFISEKWKHSECELCGNDSWGVHSDSPVSALLPLGIEEDFTRPLKEVFVAYIPLSCTNCGNLRLVLKQVFDKWRSERKTKEVK